MFGALHLEQVTTLPFSDAGAMLQHTSRLSATQPSNTRLLGHFWLVAVLLGFQHQ